MNVIGGTDKSRNDVQLLVKNELARAMKAEKIIIRYFSRNESVIDGILGNVISIAITAIARYKI